MRALVLSKAGETPEWAVRDIAVPEVGTGDVLVEVAACGLCRHDVAVVRGLLRRGVKPEVVLGHEISGRIASVGREVSSVAPGDAVVTALTESCGQCARCRAGREYRCVRGRGIGHAVDGGFAEYVRVPETSVVRLPLEADVASACVLACPIGVALQGVRDVAGVGPNDTVLVTGAGGGLGIHAVQVASSLGARVLAATTSSEKAASIEAAARCEVLVADELDFSELALALTDDAGVDVVVETVGSATLASSVRSLAPFGRIALLGEVAGGRAQLSLAELLFRDATLRGSTGCSRAHVADAAGLVADGRIAPVVSARFALEDALEACRLMEANKTFGRVALAPR